VSLRRLHQDQPASFAFTPANAEWAKGQIAKYPEGRQASAVIPLLWRGQEQEGWVTRPMIEEVARILEMEPIRVLEVATFYFMFQLRPVGSVAHIQVCGTTSCMICGAEDLIAVCREKIAPKPHELSEDGKFSWEEVECLGACSNAPMAQIGKDYYEDLTAARFGEIIDELAAGRVPVPGPQNGRWASEPLGGVSSLFGTMAESANGSVALATELQDTVKRIDGTERTASEVMLARGAGDLPQPPQPHAPDPAEEPAPEDVPRDGPATEEAGIGRPEGTDLAAEGGAEPVQTGAPPDDDKPMLLDAARPEGPDDLKRIKGVGPKLEALLHSLGVYHFDQIAAWTEGEIAWVDYHLEGFNGRIERDDWVAQAKAIIAGESDA